MSMVDELFPKVRDIVCEQLGVDPGEITNSTRFIEDLNVDSLDTVELVMEFEDEFEISIPDENAEKCRTVGDAVHYLKSVIENIEREPRTEVLLRREWITGTPRGFGAPTGRKWIENVVAKLQHLRGMGLKERADNLRYYIKLDFRIYPASPAYAGQGKIHGSDLDNLVKQTIDALALTNRSPEGLGLIATDAAIYEIQARKRLVSNDSATGVYITLAIERT